MKEHSYHTSVLTNEMLTYLAPIDGGIYVDATFGGGGHTKAILDTAPKCRVIAFDWDQKALETNGEPLIEKYGDRLTLVWANFAHIGQKLKKMGIPHVNGIIADFGTSQHQLKERAGFSFTHDTPLDMRMSPAHQKITAAIILARASENELVMIFKEYAQEPQARLIARTIVEQRSKNPLATTKQLAVLIEKVARPYKNRTIHRATQVFQALRICVNQELDNIKAFLPAAVRLLAPQGRLVCISFHSLEDRIVKHFFKEYCMAHPNGHIITPHAVKARAEETAQNKSARSAVLRVLEIGKIIKK